MPGKEQSISGTMFPKSNCWLYNILYVTNVLKQWNFKDLFTLKETKYSYVRLAAEMFRSGTRCFSYHVIVLCRNT